MLEPFAIRQTHDRVQVWAARRLPLDQPGWAKRLRDAIRQGLRSMQPREDAILSATLTTVDSGKYDAENVLLYNVGAAYFAHLGSTGLTFRRSLDGIPPCPDPIESAPRFHHDYSLVPIADARTAHTRVAARWSFEIPTLNSGTKPHHVWRAAKGSAETVHHVPAGSLADRTFSIELDLDYPPHVVARPDLFVKALLDGLIAALHTQSQIDPGPLARLASLVQAPADSCSALLGAAGPLRTLNLVRSFREAGVQWHPDDHLCDSVVLKVRVDPNRQKVHCRGSLLY